MVPLWRWCSAVLLDEADDCLLRALVVIRYGLLRLVAGYEVQRGITLDVETLRDGVGRRIHRCDGDAGIGFELVGDNLVDALEGLAMAAPLTCPVI
jgi:hypothetical protein